MAEYINTDNIVVDIDLVVPNKYNPKQGVDDNEHNHYEFEKIRESLQIAGQIMPVLVREIDGGKYEIINGYHRHRAMKELDFQEIEIKNLGKIDFDTAVSRAMLTEDTKVPIDNVELAELLKKVVTQEKPIEYWSGLLPYSPNEIQNKLDMLDFDFDKFVDNELELEDKDDKESTYKATVDIDTLEKIKDVIKTEDIEPEEVDVDEELEKVVEAKIKKVKRIRLSNVVYEKMMYVLEKGEEQGKTTDDIFKEMMRNIKQ